MQERKDSEIRILNTTVHEATEDQREAGVGDPQAAEVSTEANFDKIRALASSLLDAAEEEGVDAVLLGGMSSLAVAVHREATARGLAVVEAVTERIQDERDRFVFRHRGFRVLAEPSAEVCPPRRWKRWLERYASPDEPSDD